MIEQLYLKEADIVGVSTPGILGTLIKTFSRSPWEEPTQLTHVGLISVRGDISQVPLLESLMYVREHGLYRQYADTKSKVCIFRPKLDYENRIKVVNRAREHIGKKYNYPALVFHLFDYFLGGRYVFRRLAGYEDYPICSWLDSDAFWYVMRWTFGVPPGMAQPDDIWDYCLSHHDKYEMVRELSYL